MKALITCGGRGTRLRPISHTHNKHLIPVANKPMIFYAIEAVVEAGITEIGMVVSREDAHEVRRALGDGSRWGAGFTYIEQEAPLGLAHCVKIAESFIGRDPFVFYLGDNVIVGGVRQFIEMFQRQGSSCLLVLARVPDPERFGVPEFRDGRIVRVEEKPTTPKSPYAVAGIYCYDRRIFEAVRAIRPSARGELEISDAHQYLIDHGARVDHVEVTGWWKDTGKPDDLLEANRLVLEAIVQGAIHGSVDAASDLAGTVVIGKGARVVNSRIRGPVIIGEDTVIERSEIGPFTSIANGCEIRNSTIEYSIVMEGCRIVGVATRIARSLLGREVQIIGFAAKPKTQTFVVGDQSRIELA